MAEGLLSRRLYVADDLTGALELGAILSEGSSGCEVALGVRTEGARVVDCQTRRLIGEAAEAPYRAAVEGLAGREVYFKIDSTLRGPVREAVATARRLWPETPVVVCTAYPAMGRTVEDGRLLVDGRPLQARTAADRGAERVPLGKVKDVTGPEAWCPDARSEEDLRGIAREFADAVLMGSAGMVAAHRAALRCKDFAAGKRWLVACGSMNAVSLEQARRAGEAGVRVAYGTAEALAAKAREAIVSGEVDCVMVLGGDTAAALLADWGASSVRVWGEAAPGAPAAEALFDGRGVPLVTKAGGFGGPDLLLEILRGGETSR